MKCIVRKILIYQLIIASNITQCYVIDRVLRITFVSHTWMFNRKE